MVDQLVICVLCLEAVLVDGDYFHWLLLDWKQLAGRAEEVVDLLRHHAVEKLWWSTATFLLDRRLLRLEWIGEARLDLLQLSFCVS